FRAQDLVWHVGRVFVELGARWQHRLIPLDRKRGRVLRQPKQQGNCGNDKTPTPGLEPSLGPRFGGVGHESLMNSIARARERPGPCMHLVTKRSQWRSRS